jgi:ABC-type transport system substrate-binding protein
MDDVGIRITFRKAKFTELLKESNAGKLMFWQVGGSAAAPDADTWLQTLYSPNAGFKGNRSRFRNAEYDRLYEKARTLPDSPERTRLYQRMAKIAVAYAPMKINTHRILTDLWYPQVIGFRRPPMLGNHFWKYLDIDTGPQGALRGAGPQGALRGAGPQGALRGAGPQGALRGAAAR